MSIKQTLFMLSSIAIISLFSCDGQTNSDKISSQENEKSTVSITDKSKVFLPDMTLDIEQFGENEIKKGVLLAVHNMETLQINKIDKLENPAEHNDAHYYLLREIYKGENGQVVLLSRTSEMESIAWMISYNSKNELLDYKTVFYDEWAESISQISSIIQNNRIIITKYNLNLENEEETTTTESFYLNNSLKFVSENDSKSTSKKVEF
ncbi:MAG TPA: hypothetical protein VLZ83_15945 [Edaphocola sp.]|nr:hypothetical protein [Edaphocola sp.]